MITRLESVKSFHHKDPPSTSRITINKEFKRLTLILINYFIKEAIRLMKIIQFGWTMILNLINLAVMTISHRRAKDPTKVVSNM